jgi:LPXTG-site transpeptidase (sortase) family protein
VDAPVSPVGLKSNGTVQVPSLRTPALTGWYSESVTPGEVGTSVILGHVDSVRTGPAVFYKLGMLKRGDQVRVARQDGSVAVFAVESVEEFRKRNFPTEQVYADTDYPSLRLITCGGDFDTRSKEYLDNTVAFARYTGRG